MVELSGAAAAHEVGCGEGELSMLMAREGLRVRGSDAFGEVIAEARAPRRRRGLWRSTFEAKAVQDARPGGATRPS